MSALVLKLIAVFCMTVDHVGYFVGFLSFRIIGRLSFPIYCFLIANGERHSKHRGRYALRLFLFAFLSQPFYGITFHGDPLYDTTLNVFFTLLAGLVCLLFLRLCRRWDKWIGIPLFAVFTLLMMYLLGPLVEYGWYGIALIVLFGLFPPEKPENGVRLTLSVFLLSFTKLLSPTFLVFAETVFRLDFAGLPSAVATSLAAIRDWSVVQLFALAALFPISLYDGTKGKLFGHAQPNFLKYLFYLYYPLHLLILAFIFVFP